MGCKGLQFTHEDRYAILALHAARGNSMSSRLFQEIREQNALAYSIYSYLMSYRDSGLLTVYAGTDPTNVLEVVRLVMKEFRKIKAEGITPAEEARVKTQIKGNLVLSLESSNSHMSRLARQEIYFGKYLSVDDIIRGVEKVNGDDIRRLAQQLFTTENFALTILGPLTKADVKMRAGRSQGNSMNAQVSIRFGPDLTVEFSVPFASDATAQAQSREWLDRAYDQLGCEPIRPTGKVLLLDKILGIADAAGEKLLQRDSDWGKSYAQAVSSALDRTGVQVDVEGRTVSS